MIRGMSSFSLLVSFYGAATLFRYTGRFAFLATRQVLSLPTPQTPLS